MKVLPANGLRNRLSKALRVLLTIFLGANVLAEGSVRAQSAIPIIDLLPSRYNRSALQEELAQSLRGRLELRPVDEQLIHTLQWSVPDPTRTMCHTLEAETLNQLRHSRLVRPPDNTRDILPLLLEQARVQNQEGHHSDVLQSLSQARRLLPCQQALVTADTVYRLFWLEALAHAALQDGMAIDAFQDAFHLHRDAELPAGSTAPALQAWHAARKKMGEREPIEIDLSGLESAKIYSAGVEVGPGWRPYPGRYLLQIVGPGGGQRTMLVVIPPVGPVSLTDLFGLELPSSTRMRDWLVSSLRAGTLEEYMNAGLDAYLSERDLSAVAFVVESIYASRPLVRAYRRGKGLVDARELRILQASDRPERMRIEHQLPPTAILMGVGQRIMLESFQHIAEDRTSLEVTLGIVIPVDRVQLESRIEASRMKGVSSIDTPGCVQSQGDGANQPDPCNRVRGTLSGSALVGLPLSIGPHLWFVPASGLELMWAPNLIRSGPATASTPGGLYLVDMVGLGPRARLSLQYAWLDGPIGALFGFGITASALVARGDGAWWASFPMGGAVTAGFIF